MKETLDSLEGKTGFLNLPLRMIAEDNYDIHIAIQIVKARTARGLTQEALAELLGTSQPNVARMETGDDQISHTRLKRIARVLNAVLEPPNIRLL